MKKSFITTFSIFLLNVLVLFSCSNDDCYTPSENIIFEFVNENDENLIENGFINSSSFGINKIIDENRMIGIMGNRIENNQLVLNSSISRYDGPQYFMLILNTKPAKLLYFHIVSSKVQECNAYNIHDVVFHDVKFYKQDVTHYKIVL